VRKPSMNKRHDAVMNDKLDVMWQLQDAFMQRLKSIDKDFPREWPVDMQSPVMQRLCRETTWKAQHELAEAVIELKNAKQHRALSKDAFNREHFVEELVDAMKYIQEVLIFMGVSAEEFFASYCKKDKIVHDRLDRGL
jgi:hypothetical protein